MNQELEEMSGVNTMVVLDYERVSEEKINIDKNYTIIQDELEKGKVIITLVTTKLSIGREIKSRYKIEY